MNAYELLSKRLRDVLRRSPRGGPLPEVWAAAVDMMLALYRGEDDTTWELAQRRFALGTRRQAAALVQGRGAISRAARVSHSERDRALRRARRAMRKLGRKGDHNAMMFAPFIRAALELHTGAPRRSEAVLSSQLDGYYQPEGVHLLAAVARQRLGLLRSGETGDRLRHAGEQELHDLGVVDPERFCNVIAPGFN